MQITILTLFPEMFNGPFNFSIVKRAREKKLVTIDLVNLRSFTTDKYQSVDDRPYGGGTGMILRVDVVDQALQNIKSKFASTTGRNVKIILLDPGGKPYAQAKAKQLSKFNHLVFICGHYEGFDDRIRKLVDEEVSIGDYILTGGEIPAMVIVDSLVRLIPGVLPKTEATAVESFSQGFLEYPQYTKPPIYKNMKVPAVLLSGNHARIAQWRNRQMVDRTAARRPDLTQKI